MGIGTAQILQPSIRAEIVLPPTTLVGSTTSACEYLGSSRLTGGESAALRRDSSCHVMKSMSSEGNLNRTLVSAVYEPISEWVDY